MLTPDRFSEATAAQLVEAAVAGQVGADHRWLKALLAHQPDTVIQAVAEAFEKYPEAIDPDIEDALLAILRHYAWPSCVPAILRCLRDHEDLPDAALEALVAIGAPALEPLLELYAGMEEEQSGEVAFCLAALRIPDERVLRILTERLEFDLPDAVNCLSLYGDPAARPALEKYLPEAENDPHIKRLIEDAIQELGRGPDETRPFDVYDAFEEHLGPQTHLLDENDLLDMLKSADPEYRFHAAAAFIQTDLSEAAVAALIERAANDEDPRVRAKCWEAMAEIADDESIRSAMMSRLTDESVSKIERAGALIGLGQFASEDPIRTIAEAFYEDQETRAAAMSAMWHSLDRRFAPYFPKHLDDSDRDVRKQAISGIGYLGIHDAAERLRPLFEDEDLRANALFAYALGMRAEVSPGRVRGMLRRIEELAGGLDEEEEELVQMALDERLLLHGHQPVFHPDQHADAPDAEASPAPPQKVGRNDPCPCGSGRKYKKCHGG